jgi:hypothetical protein
MPSEMGDYLINGLSLNVAVRYLNLTNFNFNKTCLKSWMLCFAVNNNVMSLESKHGGELLVNFGLNEDSATVMFHALKYTKSIGTLKIANAKFGSEGFAQLGLFLRQNRSLTHLHLEDLDNLGALVQRTMRSRGKIVISNARTWRRC